MDLKSYLKKTNQTLYELSGKSKKISYATLWRVYHHKTNPKAQIAAEIENITEGKVSRFSVLYPNIYQQRPIITRILSAIKKFIHICI